MAIQFQGNPPQQPPRHPQDPMGRPVPQGGGQRPPQGYPQRPVHPQQHPQQRMQRLQQGNAPGGALGTAGQNVPGQGGEHPQQPPRVKGSKKKLWGKITKWTAGLATLPLLAGAGVGSYAYMTTPLPDVQKAFNDSVSEHEHPEIMGAGGNPIFAIGSDQYEYVKYNDLSPSLVQALVAVEDQSFFSHHGISPKGIVRAVVKNAQAGGVSEGASTLTQQLVKNLFLTSQQTLERKGQEAILSVKLENELEKEQILEMYFNNAFYGEGAYGIGAASKIYFDKTPKELTIPEAATLAGLVQAPSAYNPYANPKLAKERRNVVLDRMADVEFISRAQQTKFSKTKLNLAPRNHSSADKAPYFNRLVVNEAMGLLNMDEKTFWARGLKIHTTLDMRAQTIAEAKVKQLLLNKGLTSDNAQASLVSVDKNGRIIAYVGGKDFDVSQFDRASQALRSPGSTFKALVYATALQQGMTPQTVYKDEALKIGDWEPENYDHTHHGYLTLAQAIGISNNIVAIKTMRDVGPEAVVENAKKMGITADLQPDLPLALGSQGVSLKEMVGAYSVFNNNGNFVKPTAITKIEDEDGKILYESKSQSVNVFDEKTNDSIVKMLEGVVDYGTARGVNLDRDAAGKTGTSDGLKDSTFIGFTPDVTTGVRVGNDDNTMIPGLTGGGFAGVIWHDFMSEYLANAPKSVFDTGDAPSYNYNGLDMKNLADSETPPKPKATKTPTPTPTPSETPEPEPTEEPSDFPTLPEPTTPPVTELPPSTEPTPTEVPTPTPTETVTPTPSTTPTAPVTPTPGTTTTPGTSNP